MAGCSARLRWGWWWRRGVGVPGPGIFIPIGHSKAEICWAQLHLTSNERILIIREGEKSAIKKGCDEFTF